MAYTNFCCRSGGSNLNAGTRLGDTTEPGTSAALTYASGNWNGTYTFTVASGNPVSDGVAVGDFCSVYANGSTVTGYVAACTARTSTTITLSTSSATGTAPGSGTGNRTLKVGGAWVGSSGSTNFPYTLLTDTLRNSTGDPVRLNLKNDQTYAMTGSSIGFGSGYSVAGYTSTYDDGGRASITQSSTSSNGIDIDSSTGGQSYSDLIVTLTGGSGTSTGVNGGSSSTTLFRRITVSGARGHGFSLNNSTGLCTLIECEAYGCNASAGTFYGYNIVSVTGVTLVRCIAHGTSGSSVGGFNINATDAVLSGCIAFGNTGRGLRTQSDRLRLLNCDFYDNGTDGVGTLSSGAVGHYYENCNFVKNGGYGVNASAVSSTPRGKQLLLVNCGFGSGTQANSSGQYTTSTGIEATGTVTYASNVTPYNAPTTGDFTITLAAAKGAGRGNFTETQNSKSGTTSYIDIGAGQSTPSSSGSANVAYWS